MHGRKMTADDVERIGTIAREQFQLPSLAGNNFIARRVLESGPRIIAGGAARLMVEAFFWIDPQWESPRWRLEAFRLLHEQMRRELKEKGVDEAHAWLPPEIERPFSRRLIQLGWQRPAWKDFFLPIE